MELQECGGVISELPLGSRPLPQNFPARNRIISGLADVVLVIEAKEKSGSLITADMALEQGKDVYALPGPINSRLSQGCNRLIKQGAGVLLSPEDLLVELAVSGNLEQLVSETHLPITQILDTLMSLELRGLIREISKHYYVKL